MWVYLFEIRDEKRQGIKSFRFIRIKFIEVPHQTDIKYEEHKACGLDEKRQRIQSFRFIKIKLIDVHHQTDIKYEKHKAYGLERSETPEEIYGLMGLINAALFVALAIVLSCCLPPQIHSYDSIFLPQLAIVNFSSPSTLQVL
uniref:Transmembrane protein n=1 Tax=Steinernema glaseri TaxID=37863 RepID=A0A1I7ZS48_9BILA